MRMQVNREIGDREEETFVRIQSLIARRARRLVTLALGFGLLAIVAVGARWLWIAVHVAAGYAAKVTCSLALNSGQNAAQVFRDYVSLELAPLGPALRVSVSGRGAEASALGLIHVRAVYRRGLGCTLVPAKNSI
jgi:hypothetical protein